MHIQKIVATYRCSVLIRVLGIMRFTVNSTSAWSVPFNLRVSSRRYFFCGSFMFLFCLVFAMFCARLFICALWSPAGKGLTSWLSFVVSSVSLSLTFPLVSWVRCGT